MKRVGTLEIHEDLVFQRREWIGERVGWIFLLQFLLGGLAGLFGSGPLTDREERSAAGGLLVRYSGVVRAQSPELLEIQLEAAGPRELNISDDLIKTWTIQTITPKPSAVIVGTNATVFSFHGSGPGQIRIHYECEGPGVTRGQIQVTGEEGVLIKQVILP